MGAYCVAPTHQHSRSLAQFRISSDNGTSIPDFDDTVSVSITSGLSDTRLYLTPADTMNLIAALNMALNDLLSNPQEVQQ